MSGSRSRADTLLLVGRKSRRKVDEHGPLDRCRYCGNEQPGTLKPLALPPYFPVCRDSEACGARRADGERGTHSRTRMIKRSGTFPNAGAAASLAPAIVYVISFDNVGVELEAPTPES